MTYAATPASDFVCGTQQLASGITMQVFTTGRGTTYNLNVSPVIKVSTNFPPKSYIYLIKLMVFVYFKFKLA